MGKENDTFDVWAILDATVPRNKIAGLMARLNFGTPQAPCEASVMPKQRIIAVNDDGSYENFRVEKPIAEGAFARRGKRKTFVYYCNMIVPKGKEMKVELALIGSTAYRVMQEYGLVA